MRYMVLLTMNENGGPPPPALVQAMNEAMGQAFASGVMVEAGGLGPTARSGRITLRGGSVLVTDGPFTEAKEVVGGYAVIEVRSYDEAMEQARRMVVIHQQFWPGWEGGAEVRPLSGPEEGPPSP